MHSEDAAKPPECRKEDHVHREHGHERADPYHWLRRREDPAVRAHLEAENRYKEEILRPAGELREQLFVELVGRMREDDVSAAYPEGNYLYRHRVVKGKQYRIHERAPRGAGDEGGWEVYYDENAEAEGKAYFDLGYLDVSPDGQLLAHATDEEGDEEFTVRFRDLRTGSDLPDVLSPVAAEGEWDAKGKWFYYVVEDEFRRPWRLLRHRLGNDPSQDEECYREEDAHFYLGIEKSQDGLWIFAISESKETTEARALRADDPSPEARLLFPRRKGIRYYPEHHDGRWLLRTNEGAPDFRLLSIAVEAAEETAFREECPARKGVHLEEVLVLEHHWIFFERAAGIARIEIRDLRDGSHRRIPVPDPVYALEDFGNAEYATDRFRYVYSSPIRPALYLERDLNEGTETLLKEDTVPSGHDPAAYTVERQWAPAADGTRVPVTIFHRKGLHRSGILPTYLYGYGAYGSVTEPHFRRTWLTFLERGFVVAIAHVRGGGMLGENWYQAGKQEHKKNSFTDFLAVADHLQSKGYTRPDRLVIEGGSAGGLLIGAVLNLRPEGFAAAVAEVPFVDVLNTMLDASLPLTTFEYEEWGNPNEAEAYARIREYTPYENVQPADYPALLVTAGLHDPRVPYWEAAKWVARLRENQRGRAPILLHTDLESGHGGASGRYDFLREVALEQVFLLWRLGILS
ncbi:MAG: prolyl oligopeptidase family serine peptidase [Verrucomicrobia bacterium]|jgi:oligopeptidase B|nr:prolyl oligopeptidase family serine peptidase [Verrucomicrobiota bacterium]